MKPLVKCLAAAAVLLPVWACGAQVQTGVELGVGHSDNISRSVGGGENSTIVSAGVRFSIYENSRKLFADVVGDLAYEDYSGKQFDGGLVGSAYANTRLALVQDRLDWVLDDSFGQTRRDLFSAAGPDNRQHINNFSTGPNLLLPLNSATRLEMRARYGRVDYQDSPYDSNRYSGTLLLERKLSSSSSASLNAMREKVDLDAASGLGHYNRDEAYARFAVAGARNTLSLDAGVTRVELPSDSDSGTLLRFSLARKVGRLSVVTFSAGREISDPAGILGSGSVPPSSDFGSNTLSQTAAPFTRTFGGMDVSISGLRTRVQLGATINDENYSALQGTDRRNYTGTFNVNRKVSTRLNATVGYSYAKDDFDGPTADFHEQVIRGALLWQATRRIGLDFTAERYTRQQSGIAGSATENRLWVYLRYGASSFRGAGQVPSP